MGKYIKLFSTTAEYDNAKGSLDLPNVSVCEDALTTVHYNPYVDPYNGHDYVEIGGLKWATMNIGASQPTDAGLYFQWGDISGYTVAQVGTDKVFNWANYKYCDGTSSNMTKYNATDGLTTLEAVDDAAVANWGGSWRMPTNDELKAFITATNSTWTDDYQSTGVAGRVFTAKDGSGAQLFFPAAGECDNSSVKDVGSIGYYWSSSLYTDVRRQAYRINLGFINGIGINYDRYHGYSVRPVVG